MFYSLTMPGPKPIEVGNGGSVDVSRGPGGTKGNGSVSEAADLPNGGKIGMAASGGLQAGVGATGGGK